MFNHIRSHKKQNDFDIWISIHIINIYIVKQKIDQISVIFLKLTINLDRKNAREVGQPSLCKELWR